MPQPIALDPPEVIVNPNPILWTREKCYAMKDAGILTERYELIEGEIISKMGQKGRHAQTVVQIMTWLVGLFGGEFVRIQLPLVMPGLDRETSEPEPDASVTKLPAAYYGPDNPGAEEALLVIEIADTSLDFDRTKKAALYARAGIPDYWIIDIKARRILVHRIPSSGEYRELTAYSEADLVAPLARPETSVPVSQLLPPAG